MHGTKISLALVPVITGLLLGLAGYTFAYAKGYSYLLDDPRACANCHVMQEQLDGWMKGSHRAVATCNDCHTPHDLVGKYATKMRNGFWHSFYFTTGGFHEPIRILPRDRAITEAACRGCHAPVVEAIDHAAAGGAGAMSCIRCHSSVGHLGLAATSSPDARYP